MSEKCHIVKCLKLTGLCIYCRLSSMGKKTAQFMMNGMVINVDSSKIYYEEGVEL